MLPGGGPWYGAGMGIKVSDLADSLEQFIIQEQIRKQLAEQVSDVPLPSSEHPDASGSPPDPVHMP